MRLLNVDARQLHTFYDDNIPSYAILSHTWDQKELEVTFEYLNRPDHVQITRYDKIEHTCRLAKDLGLDWVWIDTCCIDKSSSAELSEAINSRFRWYKNSTICFVHLEDVTRTDCNVTFERCRWLTRGWTLQELLALGVLTFFDKTWSPIGDRTRWAKDIQCRSAIPTEYLGPLGLRAHFRRARVGQKMSWAVNRETTRKEDIAYCLFGLFDVNMPLLYGEGGHRAFQRLQEEIMKNSTDDSICAWSPQASIKILINLEVPVRFYTEYLHFASSPEDFRCLKHEALPAGPPLVQAKTWHVTTGRLQVHLPLYHRQPGPQSSCFMLLDCALDGDIDQVLVVAPQRVGSKYWRRDLFMATWEDLSTRTTLDVTTVDVIPYTPSAFSDGHGLPSNWIDLDELFLRTAMGTEDRVVDTIHLQRQGRGWVIGAPNDHNWHRLCVYMKVGLTEHEYLVLIEKRSFSWAFWLSRGWLSQLFNVYIMERPPNGTWEKDPCVSAAALQKQLKLKCHKRSAHQKDVFLMGRSYQLVEVYDSTTWHDHHNGNEGTEIIPSFAPD
ncbi:vegetative incompatibility protein HET-E-1 [Rhypophila decipiens]|uniref:Vegetative incompatibility protein HET-E-1 n=1 Tax=Rhypophila decipiens TaxID=261697 RepID=A0AAN7B2X5_9PEZI|nr:vegetative incompatibility protein HET-E-1 [Rhypophila decipiens]